MMKALSQFILLIIILVVFASGEVRGQATVDHRYRIQGIVRGATDGAMVQLIDIDELSVIDSASVDHERFMLIGKVERPKNCWLRIGDSYAILMVENVTMDFSSSLGRMKFDYVCSGGGEQQLQTSLNNAVRPFEEIYTPAYDSLYHKKFTDSLHEKQLLKRFNQANDRYMAIFIDFGKRHMNSYIGLDIVYRNRQSIAMDSLIMLYRQLSPELLQTDRARGLKTYMQGNLVKKGSKFYDFSATDIKGNPFRLSSLKGKYVYLTFGSFGCAPCKMENRFIAQHYDDLSKNMYIVNFSMDINKKEWLASAKTDRITWKNVSDLEGMAGRIKTLYDVTLMPTSFLIAPNGTVVEKFEGYSVENFKKVQDIIQKK